MESSSPKLITPLGVVVDLALAAGFFVFMLGVVRTHIPLEPVDYPVASTVIAYATTACVTGVFWLALCCFRVTFKDQRLRSKGLCKDDSCSNRCNN